MENANLALIPKGDNPEIRKFRPICMINSIAKIYEYIISFRLKEGLELSPDQFGFRRGRSTVDALRKLKDIYDKNMNEPYHRRKLMAVLGLDRKMPLIVCTG